MVFFRKKKQVDLDELFKAKYKEINEIVASGQREMDLEIQISQFELAYYKYDELLELIDQGVDYDRKHFEMLKQDLKRQIDLLKGLNHED